MHDKRPKAFALLGPTAGGKTRLALELAERLPLEIISLDSALVYRNMNIGTAKPSREELAAVPHHLIDIIEPTEAYSAAQFVSDCVRLCNEIHARGRLPLIVGGTMMYYRALTDGMNNLPEADAAVRAQLQAEREQYGTAALHRRLQTLDPESAARLQPNDTQRIERALEVFALTGIPLSRHLSEHAAEPAPLDIASLALVPENRALLHAQIAARFRQMLEQGFLDEVCRLKNDYPELTADSTSMRCVGYRQAWDYLAGETDYAAFVEKGIAATRQLAKRQLTWLRKLHADTLCDPYADSGCFQTARQAVCKHFCL